MFKAESLTGAYGRFEVKTDGDWTWKALNSRDEIQGIAAGESPTDTFTVTNADGATTITVTITINGINDGLTATDDSGNTLVGRVLAANANLLANDVDIDGDSLTISEVGGKSANLGKAIDGSDGGVFTIEADGTWEFDPDGDFKGLTGNQTRTTSVVYTAADGNGEMDTATVTVTVSRDNNAPVAVDDTDTTNENKPLNVVASNVNLLDNDTDPDNDDLSISAVKGFTRVEVDDAPDTYQPRAEQAVTGTPVVTLGSKGGKFTIEKDGSWEFDPGTDFDYLAAGATEITSVQYTVFDEILTDTATLTVTVTGTNDAPEAVDDTGETDENTVLTVNDGDGDSVSPGPGGGAQNADLLLNDEDKDTGASLSISEVNGDSASVGTAVDGTNGGSFTIRADGSWTFDPGNNFDDLKAGEIRTTEVQYTVSDGTATGADPATLTVTVTGENDDPVAVDDVGRAVKGVVRTVADGATATTIIMTDDKGVTSTITGNADLLLNDGDAEGDSLTITAVGDDENSQVEADVGKVIDGSRGGDFTIHANGAWSFDPGVDFNDLEGKATRTTSAAYTVSDGTTTHIATLTVTVTAANTAPVAVADAGAFTVTTDDKMLTVADGATGTEITVTDGKGGTSTTTFNRDLLLNDSDPDGDSLTITGVNGDTGSVGNAIDVTDGGVFTINADGSWEFDPDGDFDDLAAGATRDTSVQYTVSDGTDTHTATLTLTVTGINDAPVAVDDTGRAVKGVERTVADGAEGIGVPPFNADLLLNDRDAEGDTLSISGVNGDTGSVGVATSVTDDKGRAAGTFTIRADGSWSFDPGTDFKDLKDGKTRTTSVEYTVEDAHGSMDTATLTVTVTDANAAPMAVADAGAAEEDTVLTVADGDKGTEITNADSSTMTVNRDLLLNDTDPDGDITFTISGVRGYTADPDDDARKMQDVAAGAETYGSHGGKFTLNADGDWTFDPDGDFEDLAEGAVRTTSVQYTASDSNGGTSAFTTLTVTVTGANDAPMAKDDVGAATEGNRLTVADGAPAMEDVIKIDPDTGETSTLTTATDGADLLVNDTDPDTGDMLTITRVIGYTDADPDDGTRQRQDVKAGVATFGDEGGSFTISANGSYTFDPRGDFNDLAEGKTRTTSVQYTVSDGTATGTDTATLTVTVTGTNDAPVANADTGRTAEHTTLTVDVGDTGATNANLLENDEDADTDPNRDSLTITEVNGESANIGSAINGSNGGSFTIRADGSWEFNPDGNKNKNFNDLKPGATRTTEVQYTVSDGNKGGTATATLTVTVTGEDDVPMLAGVNPADPTLKTATGSVTEDGKLVTSGTITATGGDAGEDGFMTATGPVSGDYGTLTITATGAWTYTLDNSRDEIQGLGAGETLTDTLMVTNADGVTAISVTITINGAADAPVAVDDVAATTENAAITVADGATATTMTVIDQDTGETSTVIGYPDLLLNDEDKDGDSLTITEVNGDTASVGTAIDGSNGGSFTIHADGSWTFDPDGNKDNNFNDLKAGETRTTQVQYTVADGTADDSLTDTATLTVTVTGENDAPEAVDDAGATTENTVLTVKDGDTATTMTVTDPDTGETSTVIGYPDLLLNDTDPEGDSLTITGVKGYTRVVVEGEDDTYKAQAAAVPVTADGTATTPPTPAQTSTLGSSGGTFTLYADGSYTFDPGTDFDNLADGKTRDTSVEYTVSDGTDPHTATLTVTVTGENDGLTAEDDAGATTENKMLTVATNANLLDNDVDIDSDSLTISEVGGDKANLGKAIDGSDGGSFTINADGTWEFDPDGDFKGLTGTQTRTTSVEYTATDGEFMDTATVTVTVTRANDGLTANDDFGATAENTKLDVKDGDAGKTITVSDGKGGTMSVTDGNADLLLNDTGASLTITEVGGKSANVGKAVDAADGGKFTIRADGSWDFDPDGDFDDLAAGATKTTSVTYTASDSNGGTSAPATLTVTVTGENDAPVAVDDTGDTTENTPLTVADDATGPNAGLLQNDEDVDIGDSLTITGVNGDTASVGTAVDGSKGGKFTIDEDGSWEFNPGKDFNNLKAGEDRTTSVVYTVADRALVDGALPTGTLTDTATLTVTVTGENDAPVANDDTGDTTENKILTVADDATGTNAGLLQNDEDVDIGDSLTITGVNGDTASVGTAVDGSKGGKFTIDEDGSWEFNPGKDFNNLKAGEDRTTSVVYTVADRALVDGALPTGALTDTATLTVTVTGENDAPVAVNDVGVTTENKILTVADDATGTNAGLLQNDKDVDTGDSLTITGVNGDTASVGTAVDGSKGGSFTISADGSYTFNPGKDFNNLKAGEDRTTSVVYTVADRALVDGALPTGTLTDTATLTVTVTGENDAPVAVDDTGDTTENKILTVADDATGTNAGLLQNDKDVDTGDSLTITGVNGDTASVGTAVDGSKGGKFTIDEDGSWEFNPGKDFNNLKAGEDRTTSVVYTVADRALVDGALPTGTLTDTATLTVTVTGENDAPVAVNDVGVTTENKILTVADDATGTNAGLLQNDKDVDTGDSLTITGVNGDTASVGTAVDGSKGGKFTIDEDGSWEFNPGKDFNNLKAGEDRTTSVVYTVADRALVDGALPTGTLTDTATLTVTVTGENDAPVAVDDTGDTTENKILTVADDATGTNAGLLNNDKDPDDGDTFEIEDVGRTFNRLTAFDLGVFIDGKKGDGKADNSDGGRFKVNADGSWEFDPGTDFDYLAAGETEIASVVYRISDGNGGTDEATLTVTVTGENDDPTLTPAKGEVTEDKAVTSGNLVVKGTVATTGGDDGEDKFMTVTTPMTGDYGKLTIAADGAWTYTARNSQSDIQDLDTGETLTDTFTVTSADTVTKTTVTITINGAADTLRLDPSTGSVTEDTGVNDAGDLVTSGTVTATGDADETPFTAETDISGTYGTLDITAAGAWTYKVDNDLPAIQGLGVGDTLTDTLTVTNVDTVTTTSVTITINGAADTLRLDPSTGSVTEDTGVNDAGDLVTSGTVTATGDADETPFTAETDISGTYGTLDITAAGAWTYKVDNDLPAIQGLGVGDTLTDTLTVTNVDTVTTTSVTITINGAADTLRLDPSTGSVTEDTGVNDAGDLVTSGTVTATGDADETPFTAETDISGTYGTLDITAAGAWTYKVDNDLPAIQGLGVGDTLTDTLTVTNVDTVTTTSVTITINGAADTLRLDPSTGSVTEDADLVSGNLVTSGTVTATGDADETPFTAERTSAAPMALWTLPPPGPGRIRWITICRRFRVWASVTP